MTTSIVVVIIRFQGEVDIHFKLIVADASAIRYQTNLATIFAPVVNEDIIVQLTLLHGLYNGAWCSTCHNKGMEITLFIK